MVARTRNNFLPNRHFVRDRFAFEAFRACIRVTERMAPVFSAVEVGKLRLLTVDEEKLHDSSKIVFTNASHRLTFVCGVFIVGRKVPLESGWGLGKSCGGAENDRNSVLLPTHTRRRK